MPLGDRTGPMGRGPMTGRAARYDVGFPVPGFINPYGGRLGGGFGLGRGRGWGWRAYSGGVPYGVQHDVIVPYGSSYAPERELDFLNNQAKVLGDQLNEIRKRISELEKAAAEK